MARSLGESRLVDFKYRTRSMMHIAIAKPTTATSATDLWGASMFDISPNDNPEVGLALILDRVQEGCQSKCLGFC